MKISMKRVAALALTLVMVFGLLPVVNNTVNAVEIAGLTDGTIGLSYENEYQPNTNVTGWTASGNTISGTLQGRYKGSVYMKAITTLTITNNKSSAASLSFDYTVTTMNGSTVTIDGVAAAGNTFEKKLAAGESIKIVLFGPQTTGNKDHTATISISNLVLASASTDPITTTFEAPAFGSYTVAYGSETLTVAAGTASKTASNLPSVVYTMTANPGDGYKMVGWYNVTKDTYLGTELTYIGSFDEASTLKAVIVPETTAVFKAGNNFFSDLNEAVAYAGRNNLNQVTLVESGSLSAGDYVIPAGITLLIPKDTDYTVTGTDSMGIAPEYGTEAQTPYAFLTLTMEDGSNLVINGTLDIESKHTTLQGSKTTGGRICGPYGAIYMSPESSITVNSNANLYVWGYIYGEGSVTANAGASVYEIMQVADFPGGSNMSAFVDSDPTFDFDGDDNPANDYIKTFPFSQYYVQNIEVALTLNAGASEYVFLSMTVGGESRGLSVKFIGQGGMFNPETGVIVKDYDPTTDRLIVTVDGDASMSGITLDLSGTDYGNAMVPILGTSKVDSSTFILTLNNNITINIVSGTTTVKQDLSLLPGVEISVAKDAVLVISERSFKDDEINNLTVYGSGGYNVYLWDMENWGKYVFGHKEFIPVSYSPTAGRYVRKSSDLKDVKLDINGTMMCEGYLYTTVTINEDTWEPISGGAQVISSGKTGQIVLQNGAGWEELAFCLDGSSNADNIMFVDSLWLQNGDGSFLLTDGAEPGATYDYCDVHDLWYTEGHGNCVVINTVEITWIVNGVAAAEEYLLGETPIYKGATPAKPTADCKAYTFAGWATSPDGEALAELPVVTGEAAYFAIFTESILHEGDLDQDHYCDGCGKGPTVCVDSNQDHKCDKTGCQAVLSGCVDANKDHKCDYTGCQATLDSCVDANKDHKCDYSGCGKTVSACEDANQDHKCDYTGCKATLDSCVDVNKDHKCDYTGCKAVLSSCVDANKDHKCDYTGCQATLDSCVDANKDHKCDYSGCGKTVSACEDANQDHKCDYTGCKATLSACEDANQDHYCDYAGCKTRMSECVDNDQNHKCDKTGCNAVLSSCVDADQDHFCDYIGCQDHMTSCADNDQDHYCDMAGCGLELSVCKDANQDHKCDYTGCGKTVSACKDANQDHKCDYTGCKAVLSSCIDSNNDHKCDYTGCQAILNSCVDSNEDHKCDYTGCKAVLSSCIDNNQDHFCDYIGCQDYMTSCTDNDQDHYCDMAGCGLELSVCKDANQDHKCDYTGCGKTVSVCKDANQDHKCDYTGCQAILSRCVDNNKDHKCDYTGCQATLDTCVDNNRDHKCDYAGCQAVLSYCIDNNKDHKCDYTGCNKTLSVCEDVNQDHFCDYIGCQDYLTSCADNDQDHYCDMAGCRLELTLCRDNNKDHKCDYTGCQATLDRCVDANQDHYCDYAGCKALLSACKDDNKDHKCDYAGCQAVLSLCHDINKDHKCDYTGCQAVLSYCIDANQDHICDYAGCAKPLSECSDVDQDHKCDYTGCGKVLSVCEDAGQDHCCDYTGCRKELTGCADTNSDHYCDYAGCKEQMSRCVDLNQNHKCDYAGCNKVLSSCKDGNNDHKCDYTGCNKVLSSCKDDNSNHYCDICDAKLSECADTNFNHYCDLCSAKLSDCKDLDQDHYCDYTGCGKKLSNCADDAADGDHICDYAGCDKVISTCAGGQADCLNGKICSDCGTEYTQALGHGHSEGWEYIDCSEIHEVICKDCYDYSYTEDHTFVNHDCVCSAREFYTLTFMDGQNVFTVGGYPYGSPANFYGMPIPQAPVGYEWDGWYTADGVKIMPGMTLDQDVVCYATWKASFFHLTVYALDGSALLNIEVPYGTNVYDYIKGLNGGSVSVNEMDQIGKLVFTGWMDMNANAIVDGYTMPAEDLEIVSNFAFTGWIKYGYIDGWVYESLDQIQKTGWTEIDGNWYYLDTETGIRAEGLIRVPYPQQAINGVTYGPNMEDVIYANNKGIRFLDAITGLFLFDENGAFRSGYTGLVGDSYAVNGYLVWHYGMVEINGNYYYFIGDVNNGGNIMVKDSDYYISRNTDTNRSFVIGGLYTFGADGAMCMYEGITNVNGTLRYYEDAQLMLGKGLTQVGENTIYVNSYGALVVDAEYYVGTNAFDIAKGIYYFDANGFLVVPEAQPGKEGLHFEDGKWFYYVDGAKAYCAGLIEIDGNWVYVKSDGSLATGVYYVTNTNGHATITAGTKCTFDDNGVLIDPFIGVKVLEEGSIRDDFDYWTDIKLNSNGKLTIDVSNVWMDSDVDCVGFNVDIYAMNGDYYGEIVRGDGTVEFDLPAGEYSVRLYVAWFDDADEDLLGHGKGNLDYKISFIGDGSPLNGIVDGYYYVDGHIAYAAGLIELDGIYYYVRSNGQIVTDCQYWITNVNDTGYEPGLYEFDCDGWMYEIYVETFTGIKDGKFYIEDAVAYNAGLMKYNGGYIYVRSNGEIATGKYWITNHNGLLPEGFYDFGEDGFYYPAMPENAYLLMEVEKDVDEDGFWDYNAIANAVRASADGHIFIEVTDVTFEDEIYGQGGFCISFDGSYWVYQWEEVYKVGTGIVMIPVSANEDVICFVNPADIYGNEFDFVRGTISYKVWSDVECELVQGSAGE